MPILPTAVASFIVFVVVDALWLYFVAAGMFKADVGPILRETPDFSAAALFYVIYVIGMLVFVVAPAVEHQSLQSALWRGALFGLVAYATFDLTNMTVIQGWTWRIALPDMAWGAVVTAIGSAAGYTVAHWWSAA